MSRPRLLLVPWVSELQWDVIEPRLAEWADVAAHDPPGVGDEPLPEGAAPTSNDPDEADRAFHRWRQATAERSVAEADKRGWNEFLVVSDSFSHEAAVRVAEAAHERVRGIALGHAALETTFEGDRPSNSKAVWDAMRSLIHTDQRAFISYGISQLTLGAVDEEQAAAWLRRFPDERMVTAIWEGLGRNREPIGRRLRDLGLPLLLAEHQGCLIKTEQGFEDAVAAFPDARTASCPEACSASPTFAEALHDFCAALERQRSWA